MHYFHFQILRGKMSCMEPFALMDKTSMYHQAAELCNYVITSLFWWRTSYIFV